MKSSYEEIKMKIPNLFKSKDRRPCLIYQDVAFEKPSRISLITFRNYYCYTVRIDYLEKGNEKSNYKTLVKCKYLMKDPHFEDDSQDYHIVDLTKIEFPTLVSRLRIYLKQPSPNWRKIGINEIKCYVRVWKRNQKLEFVPVDSSKSHESSSSEKSKGSKLYYVDPQEYEKNIRWFVGSILFSDLKKMRKYNKNSRQSEVEDMEQNFYHSEDFEEVTSLVIGDSNKNL